MVTQEKLLKTWAYAVITICCLTGFGHTSELCSGDCGNRAGASIAFGVLSTFVSLGMLVLWFIADEFASKICIIASHVLFAFIVVALGTGASGTVTVGGIAVGSTLVSLAYFTAIVIAMLLVVHSWHNFDSSMFKKAKNEDAADPSVTAQAPESLAGAHVSV